MADYTVTIPDEQVPCITAARLARNEGLPATVPDPENPGAEIPNPLIIETDAGYVQFVMRHAVISYCRMYEGEPGVPVIPDASETNPALFTP